ncbi:MAG: hypothetical protein MZV70_19480 [Desulfobacterales bacterium]|nr:hypothetical protein [Desulfobacterales bacterium]
MPPSTGTLRARRATACDDGHLACRPTPRDAGVVSRPYLQPSGVAARVQAGCRRRPLDCTAARITASSVNTPCESRLLTPGPPSQSGRGRVHVSDADAVQPQPDVVTVSTKPVRHARCSVTTAGDTE